MRFIRVYEETVCHVLGISYLLCSEYYACCIFCTSPMTNMGYAILCTCVHTSVYVFTYNFQTDHCAHSIMHLAYMYGHTGSAY